MDYNVLLSSLNGKLGEFESQLSSISTIIAEGENEISSFSGTEISGICSQVTSSLERLNKGYHTCQNWLSTYLTDLNSLESSLASFNCTNIDSPTEFTGEFADLFGKMVIPILRGEKDPSTMVSGSGEIDYSTSRYADTTVWYAVISKDKMPKLGVANDNYDYLSNEAPTSMARRNNAKLAINFGLTGDPAGMIYTNGRLVSDTGNRCDETLYMDQNGTLNSVRNDQYTTQDIIDMNPVWASKGFYTIARDGEYVDENTIDPSLSVDRHPRTFIGQDYDGNYIVGVCDGRGENEAGLTLREVYDFVNTEVTDDLRFLFNGDGGGSSAFIYDGEKLNSNTDGSERERPDLIYWT